MITNIKNRLDWRFTRFYRILEGRRRMESRDLLRTLGQWDNRSWVVMGDFNKALVSQEKMSARVRDDKQM